jgi:hypothetical protein
VFCTPHMKLCVCVNWMLVSEMHFPWKEKSAPFVAARARRAPCLTVHASGACVGVAKVVCAGVGFKASISVWRGVSLWLRDECVEPCTSSCLPLLRYHVCTLCPVDDRHVLGWLAHLRGHYYVCDCVPFILSRRVWILASERVFRVAIMESRVSRWVWCRIAVGHRI